MKSLYEAQKALGKVSGSYRKFLDHVRAHRPHMAKDLSRCIPLAAVAVRQKMLDKVSETYGILCMSNRRDSILMWGHYCDKHKGLVIGFDASNDLCRELRPVEYIRERIVFDATWIESDPRLRAFDDQIIFSKNEDWSYEEEWRQLFTLGSLKARPLDNGSPGYFLLIPPDAVVSVTLGARSSQDLANKVRSVLGQPRLSHIKPDRAALHDSRFALKFG